MFRTEAIKIETGSDDEDGMLVFDDRHLLAVFVRLADRVHEPGLAGMWNLEVRFDAPFSDEHPIFADIGHAIDWLQNERASPTADEFTLRNA